MKKINGFEILEIAEVPPRLHGLHNREITAACTAALARRRVRSGSDFNQHYVFGAHGRSRANRR